MNFRLGSKMLHYKLRYYSIHMLYLRRYAINVFDVLRNILSIEILYIEFIIKLKTSIRAIEGVARCRNLVIYGTTT